MLTREGPFLSWLLAPLTGFANSGIMSPVKYWEIGADKLSAAGWSWGYCSAVTRQAGGGLLMHIKAPTLYR